MFYKLLGIAVWHGGKYLLKRRYSAYLPVPVLAGLGLAAAGGVALAIVAAKRNGSTD
jgi:hypothetical protein